MRVWGRTYDATGKPAWVAVTTDAHGDNSAVYFTALAQDLLLNLGESPFHAQNGTPANQSIVTQVYPDYYATLAQSQYAQYFASLTILRQPQSNPPLYNVQAVTHKGAILGSAIPI